MKWFKREEYSMEGHPYEGKPKIHCKRCNFQASEYTKPKMSQVINKPECPKCKFKGAKPTMTVEGFEESTRSRR